MDFRGLCVRWAYKVIEAQIQASNGSGDALTANLYL